MKIWSLAILFVLAACPSSPGGGDGGDGDGDDAPDGDDPPGPISPFDEGVTTVRVEIDYELGSEPYTGNVIGFGDTFDLTINNLDRLFSGTRQLDVPTTLAGMERIPPVTDEELTVGDLLAIAEQHRDSVDTTDTKTYYVLFVSGNFATGDGVESGVLGVSIGNTGVIAMFKDVIDSTGIPGFPNLERFVEQSVLVHELGHAIGLVNNGVPLVADHHDEEHGAHCDNNNCVMFWLNEGASDMAQFARDVVVSGDTILFDAACLADVDALTRP